MATAKLVAEVVDASSGTRLIEALWTITAPIAAITSLGLVSGDNTIAWPTSSRLLIAFPSPTETATIKLKGAGGDTGVVISNSQPLVLAKTVAADIIINASATGVGTWQFHFI